jgi:hypothetical protein
VSLLLYFSLVKLKLNYCLPPPKKKNRISNDLAAFYSSDSDAQHPTYSIPSIGRQFGLVGNEEAIRQRRTANAAKLKKRKKAKMIPLAQPELDGSDIAAGVNKITETEAAVIGKDILTFLLQLHPFKSALDLLKTNGVGLMGDDSWNSIIRYLMATPTSPFTQAKHCGKLVEVDSSDLKMLPWVKISKDLTGLGWGVDKPSDIGYKLKRYTFKADSNCRLFLWPDDDAPGIAVVFSETYDNSDQKRCFFHFTELQGQEIRYFNEDKPAFLDITGAGFVYVFGAAGHALYDITPPKSSDAESNVY